MRRAAWIGSALIHVVAVCLFLLVRLPVPEPPLSYVPVSLVDLPETPAAEEDVSERERPPATPQGEERDVPVREEGTASGVTGMEKVGVGEVPDWVSGPPPVPLPEMDTRALARTRASSPIREALAGGGYHPLGDPSATVVDTLLWAQARLEWLADQAMEAARDAPKDHGILEPAPRPGSIQELRGEPMMPVAGLAAAGARLLADLGTEAWNRLLGRDPDAVEPPEMDLTYEEVLAFAALDDHRGLTIFEWYGRLAPGFRGGLGDLQGVAADLSDKRLLRLEAREEGFLYRRTTEVQDVVDYYVAFMNRLPRGESERRDQLERILAALVREPRM